MRSLINTLLTLAVLDDPACQARTEPTVLVDHQALRRSPLDMAVGSAWQIGALAPPFGEPASRQRVLGLRFPIRCMRSPYSRHSVIGCGCKEIWVARRDKWRNPVLQPSALSREQPMSCSRSRSPSRSG